MEFLLYLILGLLVASFEAILFIRFSKNIIANTVGVLGGIGVVLGIWQYSYNMLQIENLMIPTLLCFVVSFGVGFCVLLWLFSRIFINKIDNSNSLRMIDILIGDVKALENHTSNRQKQIDKELNYTELLEMKEKNEAEIELISRKKNDLDKLKTTLHESLSETICLELPVNYRHPVTVNYLNNMEPYIKAFVIFDNYIFNSTNQFIENQGEHSKRNLKMFLKTYLAFLCLATSKILFNNHEGVRTHVRYLKDGNYETIACCIGEDESDKDLTKIPIKKGMIFKSCEIKQSLIKSCNLDDHFPAQNDHVWKDYITIPIIDIESDQQNVPLLSIGISIKYPGLHSDMLKFLNFMKIETVYSKNICKIDEKYDIMAFICEGGV